MNEKSGLRTLRWEVVLRVFPQTIVAVVGSVAVSALATRWFLGDVALAAIPSGTVWKISLLASSLAPVLIYPILAFRMIGLAEHLESARNEIDRIAMTDPLTGLLNRRGMDAAAAAALCELERGAWAAALMCDIDFFKSVNDRYGHDAGDAVLREVADAVCNAVVHPQALFGRHGGEEFVVLLPGVTEDEACVVAETIRRACASRVFGADAANALRVTLSIGVAALQNQNDPRRLFVRADSALYRAKTAGRNRVSNAMATFAEQLAG